MKWSVLSISITWAWLTEKKYILDIYKHPTNFYYLTVSYYICNFYLSDIMLTNQHLSAYKITARNVKLSYSV